MTHLTAIGRSVFDEHDNLIASFSNTFDADWYASLRNAGQVIEWPKHPDGSPVLFRDLPHDIAKALKAEASARSRNKLNALSDDDRAQALMGA